MKDYSSFLIISAILMWLQVKLHMTVRRMKKTLVLIGQTHFSLRHTAQNKPTPQQFFSSSL